LLPPEAFPENTTGNQIGTFSYDAIVPLALTQGAELVNEVSIDFDGNNQPEYSDSATCTAREGEPARLIFVAPTTDIRTAIHKGELQGQPDADPDFEVEQHFVDIEQYIISDLTETGYVAISDDVYVQMYASALPRQALLNPLDNPSQPNLDDGRRQVVITVSSIESEFSFVASDIGASSTKGGAAASQKPGDTRDGIEVVLQEIVEGSGIYRSVSPIILSTNEAQHDICGDVYNQAATTVQDISYWVSDSGAAQDDSTHCRLSR